MNADKIAAAARDAMNEYRKRAEMLPTGTLIELLVPRLANDEYMRREFLARLSCAMVQTGSHIDSLPTNHWPPLVGIGDKALAPNPTESRNGED